MYTLSEIKDTVTIITLVIGSYVAISGLQNWKRQIAGNHEYTLAKNILLNTYKYREGMIQLRHPAVMNYEYPISKKKDSFELSEKEKRFRNLSGAYQKRWDRIIELKPVIYESILESEVVWGNGLRVIYNEIFKLEFQVAQEISTYLQNMDPSNCSNSKLPKDALVFDLQNDLDPYRINFNPMINQIELFLMPIVKLQTVEGRIIGYLKEKFQFAMQKLRKMKRL